jgi:hypothetical protein
MKTSLALAATLSIAAPAIAGDLSPNLMIPGHQASISADPFASAIRPITAPTVFDLAVPRTQIHAIYMRQNLPGTINTTANPALPLGGDFNLYALQFEIALNERTSIVATKDGYIDFNPDNNLTPQSGFANLGLGIKRALIYRPENKYILSGIASVEIPIGDSEVFQGNADGALNLNLAGLKLYDRLQLASNMGLHIPFDDAQSLTGSISLHASYEVTPWFTPLIELNWFHVFDEGDGTSTFDSQLGATVPTIANFEGGDLINLGSANGGENEIVTLGVGFRSKINEQASFGLAYEIPLTDEEDNLMEDRLTVDFVYKF